MQIITVGDGDTDAVTFAVDAASDIAVWGTPPDDDSWPIDIEPLPGYAPPAMLALTPTTAIATSGRDQRQWRRGDGSQAHHIIDPRTGAPTQSDVVRASVIAPTLVGADVAARTLDIRASGGIWLASSAPRLCNLAPSHEWANCRVTDVA